MKIEQPGEYELQINQFFDKASPGRYRATLGKESFLKTVDKTSSTEFKTVTVGKARFEKPGLYRIWIRPQYIADGEYLMKLKDATLTRVGS
ncbi:hypothetical protein [Verrucomicrobium spinosum]|uniref:hypothetical protein n=1 Tax=Verrucomicrobium spinosum TaxID=2736 RepID=UPI000A678471|nr:hypothetical protein [Verrucomicrobium spinosum]